jgi:hypothetical protein
VWTCDAQGTMGAALLFLTKPVLVLQAKRLDELDRLYRDEALARKKTHNAMEDLKVSWHLVLRRFSDASRTGRLQMPHQQRSCTSRAVAAESGLKVGR